MHDKSLCTGHSLDRASYIRPRQESQPAVRSRSKDFSTFLHKLAETQEASDGVCSFACSRAHRKAAETRTCSGVIALTVAQSLAEFATKRTKALASHPGQSRALLLCCCCLLLLLRLGAALFDGMRRNETGRRKRLSYQAGLRLGRRRPGSP